jgi:hypothetical protein
MIQARSNSDFSITFLTIQFYIMIITPNPIVGLS